MIDSASNTLSIIIVNYKSWKVLRDCLNSISEIIIDDTEIETIVVDNASNDGEITKFKNDFPLIIFLENTGNNGFSNGCNLGAKTAKGKYLLFLNPDTILNKDALSEMLTYYQKHKNCGIVSCLLRNDNGYEKTKRFFPKFNTLFGVLRSINKDRLDQQIIAKENVISVDWVSGALVLISKNWLEKINFWNEDYWMYFEDVDLSKKVSDLGGEIALLTNCEIVHNHGGSSRINLKTAKITKSEVIKSKHVYLSNHFHGSQLFVLQLLVVLITLLEKIFLGILSLFVLFIPKARLYFLLMIEIINYYFSALFRLSWLSKRSMNYKKHI